MNRYLEKVAGFVGAAENLGIATAHLGRKAVKGVATTLHKANGGAYRDFAVSKMKLKPEAASKVGASFKGRREFIRNYRSQMGFKPEKGISNTKGALKRRSFKSQYPKEAKNLKRETLSAKLGLTLGVGGTAYAGNRYLEKAKAKAANTAAYPEYPSYY